VKDHKGETLYPLSQRLAKRQKTTGRMKQRDKKLGAAIAQVHIPPFVF
jgi:hypothetical protein